MAITAYDPRGRAETGDTADGIGAAVHTGDPARGGHWVAEVPEEDGCVFVGAGAEAV